VTGGADRGVVPVVGKALEVGLVVLYAALVTTALYGGVVPDYRTDAAEATAERALSRVADRVEDVADAATGADVRRARVRASVDLPPTLRGAGYRVTAASDSLVLDHPRAGVGARVALVLPPSVDRVGGEWRSGPGEPLVVVARSADGNGTVELR
jgi:hypothetical protein